jgi:hypothetical protein
MNSAMAVTWRLERALQMMNVSANVVKAFTSSTTT